MLDGLDNELLYTLEARRAGFAIHAVAQSGVPISHHAPGKEVHFTARESGTLKLDLRLPDGSQPERATVNFLLPDGRRGATWYWSPAEPERQVDPGEWRLAVRAGRHSEHTCADELVSIVQGRTTERTLRFELRPVIAGLVRIPEGVSAVVELQRKSAVDFERVDLGSAGIVGNPRSLHARNDLAYFNFRDLEPGEYRLILRSGGKALETRTVTLAQGVEYVELRVPEPDSSGYIVVRVTGPDGPISGSVTFMVETRRDSSRGTSGASALNRGNGVYWIKPPNVAANTSYSLTVSVPELGSRTFPFDPETTSTLDAHFTAPAFVLLEIVGYDEHPQRSLLVADFWPSGQAPERTFPRARIGNRAAGERVRHLGPLEPGEYVFALLLTGANLAQRFELDRKTMYVGPGEQTVLLTPPELYEVTVVIPPEYRRQQITLRHMGTPEYTVTQPQAQLGQEEFVARMLKPGDHMISSHLTGAMFVSLPAAAGTRVEFQPMPFNAYLLYRPYGLEATDIGVKPGDIVVEINGVAIEDMEQARRLSESAREGETTTWTVLRQGARLTVTFRNEDLAKAGLAFAATRVD
jgi:hypothetical protein